MNSGASALRNRVVSAILFAVGLTVAAVIFLPSAAMAGSWEPYVKDDNWHCSTAPLNGSSYTIYGESCVVVNGKEAQAVTIVHNNSGSPVNIATSLYLKGALFGGDHNWVFCTGYSLSDGYSRACFAPIADLTCGQIVYARSEVKAGTVYRPWESPRWTTCT